jgi:hypothetical protein
MFIAKQSISLKNFHLMRPASTVQLPMKIKKGKT